MRPSRIIPLVAASAAAIALAVAPVAAASTYATGSTIESNSGNAQLTATPGNAAQGAAQLQQPFGGDYGALLFHH